MSDMCDISGRAVLVVEDNDDDFDTVVEAARRAGLRNRIVHAPDAETARQLLPKDGGTGEEFAFILMDQNLPGINGCDLLRELRQDPAYHSMPVVFYTTSANPVDRDACYGAGANAYHVKSVRFDQSLATLADIFHYWLHIAVLPRTRRRGYSSAKDN